MKQLLLILAILFIQDRSSAQETSFTVSDTAFVKMFLPNSTTSSSIKADTVFTLKNFDAFVKCLSTTKIYYDTEKSQIAASYSYPEKGLYFKKEFWNKDGIKIYEEFNRWDTTITVYNHDDKKMEGMYYNVSFKNWYETGKLRLVVFNADELNDANRIELEFYPTGKINAENFKEDIYGSFLHRTEYYKNGSLKMFSSKCCDTIYWDEHGNQIAKSEFEKK
ncbi:MAG: hypothetical protein K9J17_11280 [Flavobacteriales bacterium]|nr:hypothetical protein [Flavobacteriales bacterium]